MNRLGLAAFLAVGMHGLFFFAFQGEWLPDSGPRISVEQGIAVSLDGPAAPDREPETEPPLAPATEDLLPTAPGGRRAAAGSNPPAIADPRSAAPPVLVPRRKKDAISPVAPPDRKFAAGPVASTETGENPPAAEPAAAEPASAAGEDTASMQPAPGLARKPARYRPDREPSGTEPVQTAEGEVQGAAQGAAGDDAAAESRPVGSFTEAIPLYEVNPPPAYPGLARKRGYQGTTLLHVLVDEQGRVARIDLKSSSGHAILDRAATEAVQHWRFQAGIHRGAAAAMWVDVPVRFRLE